MKQVAQFEKVSIEEFTKANYDHIGLCLRINGMYNDIMMPTRSTSGSAGYDFRLPFGIELKPGETITIGTGIKAKIDEGYVLMCYPRSSMGIKYGISLLNTVGIIDSDYYNNEDNEGHILIGIKNNSDKIFKATEGVKFCQGIFVPFGITYDDNSTETRTGGIGSTGTK